MSAEGPPGSRTPTGFLVALAWRNLWRHKRRSLITASAMAVALAMCMAAIAFDDGAFEAMFDVMVEQQLGHVQVHHPDYPAKRSLYDTVEGADERLAAIDALPRTRAAAPRLNGYALLGGAEKSVGGQLIGIDPARERKASPLADRVQEGRFLGDEPSREVLVGTGLAEDLRVGIGDEVVVVTQAADGSLGNDLYTVVGTVKTGVVAMDRTGAYLHLADAQSLLVLPDQVHQIQLLADDPETLESYADSVRAAVGNPDVEVQTWWEASPFAAQMMGLRDSSSFIVLGIVFVVAAFGVLNTMMMSVFERTVELGVLKAIGLRPARMVLLIVVESVFLAVVAAAIGLALGGLLDWYLVVHGIDYSSYVEEGFSWAGIMFDPVMKASVHADGIIWTVLALFSVSVLASIWPAARAARLEPVEAIRTE